MVKKDLFSMEIETKNFNRHIKQFKKRVNIADEIVLKKFAFDLIKKIIEKSPVDTGRSRAGWYVAMEKLGGGYVFDRQSKKPVRDSAIDPKGYSESEVALGKGEGSYTQSLTGKLKWIELVNGVNYIIFLEYGSSQQAPYGMVRLSMRELSGKKLPRQMGKALQKEWNKFYRI